MRMRERTGEMYNPDQSDPDERYASDFAAALLMPEPASRQVWEEQEKETAVVLTAYRFGVPPEAVLYRLQMLGVALPE